MVSKVGTMGTVNPDLSRNTFLPVHGTAYKPVLGLKSMVTVFLQTFATVYRESPYSTPFNGEGLLVTKIRTRRHRIPYRTVLSPNHLYTPFALSVSTDVVRCLGRDCGGSRNSSKD